MFFSDEELKIAEDLAWKMLDGFNHAYMPDISEYAHFYYKEKLILDPWMNENMQFITWPNHKSKETRVDPVEYYGRDTIEDYLVNLFMLNPEWAPEITARIKPNLSKTGRLVRWMTIMPIEVCVAMSDDQAEDEHGHTCIEDVLPESPRIYFDMVELPPEFVYVVENGWRKEIIFLKKNSKKVFELLYPNGINFDYKKLINRVKGKEVRLIGTGD